MLTGLRQYDLFTSPNSNTIRDINHSVNHHTQAAQGADDNRRLIAIVVGVLIGVNLAIGVILFALYKLCWGRTRRKLDRQNRLSIVDGGENGKS